MGHIQCPKPIQFYYISANSIITETVVQCRSKSWHMQFYYIHDWYQQKQFHAHWKQRKQNIADYLVRHNYTQHQISVQPTSLNNTIQYIYIYIYLNYQNYLRHCKGVFKHILHKPQETIILKLFGDISSHYISLKLMPLFTCQTFHLSKINCTKQIFTNFQTTFSLQVFDVTSTHCPSHEPTTSFKLQHFDLCKKDKYSNKCTLTITLL